ncbi:hypothetical protein [Lysinibacillus parviboronicapiens]|uniref:hypothetical protein n=1 Tax=Lysinibacillus parviboronicapiens TaxID=436516 RepID=UPI0006D13E70|nr:hypothetical protein [Lysinibacillus parviboronicapiens]
MYYNPYPYFVYANHYPSWVMPNYPTPSPFPRHLAMPTNPANNSPFPPVDTHKLVASAKRVQTIIRQAQLLTDKINESQQFAHNLMNAAQLSNKTEVDKLIASTGITIKFDTKYTPDNLRVLFTESDCCGLTLNLHW